MNHYIFLTYSDGGRPNSASVFVGGFILGGLVVGALGCVYAPQVVFVTVTYILVFNRIRALKISVIPGMLSVIWLYKEIRKFNLLMPLTYTVNKAGSIIKSAWH